MGDGSCEWKIFTPLDDRKMNMLELTLGKVERHQTNINASYGYKLTYVSSIQINSINY